MLADHTDTFTTSSGAPRKALYREALHPSPKDTVRLACNVKYVGQSRPPLRPQDRLYHPSPSASGRVPLLETSSFQPRGDCPPSQHFREEGVGRASSTEMGQLFQRLAVFGPPPPLLQQRPADTESSIPQRRPGDAPLHHRPHRYSRGTPQHCDVGTAPPPFSGWYGAHRHPLRMWAAPPPQSRYGALPPRGRQCTSFNTQQANIVLQPHHTSYGAPPPPPHPPHTHTQTPSPRAAAPGGCSGDTCVTQACSVYPAVCFNGSLFLYTSDRCVLVA